MLYVGRLGCRHGAKALRWIRGALVSHALFNWLLCGILTLVYAYLYIHIYDITCARIYGYDYVYIYIHTHIHTYIAGPGGR